MSLTSQDIKKIAKLSRIRIHDDECPHIAQQLSGIFGWIDKLQQVDTTSVQTHRELLVESTPERTDTIIEANQAEIVLSNAPQKEFNMYKVPKVVE